MLARGDPTWCCGVACFERMVAVLMWLLVHFYHLWISADLVMCCK